MTRELYRGIATDRGKLGFNGKMIVRESAPGADSDQSLKTLLTGTGAEASIRPQLEIYTDKVRAKHGATTGKLDEQMLFYLLSRGIDRRTAQTLLQWAFIEDAISRMDCAAAARRNRTTGRGAAQRGVRARRFVRAMNANPAYPQATTRNASGATSPSSPAQVHGKPLVFLDSAASSQRPASVIAAVDDYEKLHHANVHRGVHQLSQEATQMFEHARERVREFVNAASTREVIFTRGTTESINLVAQSYARPRLQRGDEILLTGLEHHANIVPWQLVAEQTGAVVKAVPIDRRGVVDARRISPPT